MPDNVYSLNPHPLSGAPMKPEEYKKTVVNWSAIVAAAIAVFILLYWWNMSRQNGQQSVVDKQAQMQAEVAAILQSSNVRPSQTEIDSVASQLSRPAPAPSAAARQAVAQQLQSSSQEF